MGNKYFYTKKKKWYYNIYYDIYSINKKNIFVKLFVKWLIYER